MKARAPPKNVLSLPQSKCNLGPTVPTVPLPYISSIEGGMVGRDGGLGWWVGMEGRDGRVGMKGRVDRCVCRGSRYGGQ